MKIVCVLCKSQLAYNKNTSNLRMHLQNRHPKELMELVAEHPPETRPSTKVVELIISMTLIAHFLFAYDWIICFWKQQTAKAQLEMLAQTNDDSSPRIISKNAKRTKYHRSLENTDSGFTKHGNVYFTPADGSIEIDGDLQFMSDPNITISNFTEDDESSNTIQILAPSSGSSSNLVLQQVIFHFK